jgi:hypothetical protein
MSTQGDSRMEIDYQAPRHVRDIIAGIGRTEDLKFSPSNKLLAVAGYTKNKIAVFYIHIDKLADCTKITLKDAFELYSKQLNEPHGLDFIDEETIIVANRSGDAIFLQLPPAGMISDSLELTPLGVISSGSAGLLRGPASVSIFRKDQKLYEALICNNHSNNVTRHLVDLSAGCSVKTNEILLSKRLASPDGVSISRDRHWMAVSNRRMRGVFLYEYRALNPSSEPDGILRYVFSPHGVRFTSDGEFIIVADGATPYLHIYSKNGSSWRGVHNPTRSLRVLDDEEFLRGRYNNHEGGGPKGIDVDNAANVLAVTGEGRPLAFFDLKTVLSQLHSAPDENHEREIEMRYELEWQNQFNKEIRDAEEEAVAVLKRNRSWRITAPLRGISAAYRSFR